MIQQRLGLKWVKVEEDFPHDNKQCYNWGADDHCRATVKVLLMITTWMHLIKITACKQGMRETVVEYLISITSVFEANSGIMTRLLWKFI